MLSKICSSILRNTTGSVAADLALTSRSISESVSLMLKLPGYSILPSQVRPWYRQNNSQMCSSVNSKLSAFSLNLALSNWNSCSCATPLILEGSLLRILPVLAILSTASTVCLMA